MRNFKLFITFLLAASICFLTACGGSGGSSSSKNSVDTNNRAVQAVCIAGVMTNLRNNINNIFPSTSIRFDSGQIIRASLSEVATGEELMKLSGITEIKNEGGFVDELNDSIEKFINRNTNNIIYQTNSMAIAKNGSRNIGLSIITLGSALIKTYFATEENSSEIVGVSYIKNTDYTTYVFKTLKDFSSLEGRVFKYDQNTFTYNQANVSGFSMAEVYGDYSNFNYNDLTENTSDTFSYDGKLVSNGNSKSPDTISYLVKYPETLGIRFAVKPLLDNADKIIKTGQNPNARANIAITDKLKQFNTMGKIKVLIPAATIDDFKSSFSNFELLIDNQIATDTVISGGLISLITAKHPENNLNVGLLEEAAIINLNKQKLSFNTKVWLVADPDGKAILCFAYCYYNNSKNSTTFIFKIDSENKNVEGIGFWNDLIQPNGLFENFGFDENEYQINCRNSIFIGNNPEQFTYMLYNSTSRNMIDGYVTIKYDGTLISKK